MGKSILREKSLEFGQLVMITCRILKEKKQETVLSRQLLRSGTAVGALIMESEFAQSRADFISKLSIALKEANESKYWLKLLKASGFLTTGTEDENLAIVEEIIRMLVSSLNTAKGRKK